MRFQLEVSLTEDDYLAFNQFHSLESITSKKMIKKSRVFFITAMVFIMASFIITMGLTTFSTVFAVLMGVFTILYMLFFKKILTRNIKAQVTRLKKTGKLPFDAVSKLEFYDDKLVEIAADKRIEQGYGTLERICMVKDQYIYVYSSSVNAYILPIPQLTKQLEPTELLSFLASKCNTVEYY